MIKKLGDNICSPLGFTTEENWQNLLAGNSGLRYYENGFDLPESFCASLIDKEKLEETFSHLSTNQSIRYTNFEKISIISATDAIERSHIDASAADVIFIFSTTKGNVELLQDLDGYESTRPYLWRSAELVAQHFGNPNSPIVVSNACISGCAAQITALRLLESQRYRYAVVIGADLLSKFVISGFQSFKALSPTFCQPFDAERVGLNLGEAAATIVYGNEQTEQDSDFWLISGALCNDATHISAPSRTAEGLVSALQQATESIDLQKVAFINAHGTATRYNDDMESVAVQRMAMTETPVNSLKGYFGHTLGAAGVLETIISVRELREGKILPTRGFQNAGTVAAMTVATEVMPTDKPLFVKMISGFGGSNAVICGALPTNVSDGQPKNVQKRAESCQIATEIRIDNQQVVLDGEVIFRNENQSSSSWLSDIYRHIGMEYPKFFKMDRLCKAGSLAAELLIRKAGKAVEEEKRDWAVVCFNSAGSLDDDRTYQQTIQDSENYFPSPSVFVYTLSNIVTGEIAIRHKITGESSCYVAPAYDEKTAKELISEIFRNTPTNYVIGGWIDYDDGRCDVRMAIFTKEKTNQ